MIADGFIFFNEFELLELRLQELEDTIDVHILVESAHTHTGIPKPYYFEENKERFGKWLNKIRHIKLELPPKLLNSDLPARDAAFAREAWQRDQIAQGFWGLKQNDWVILSDVDEIPRPDLVKWVATKMDGKPVTLIQKLHYYYVNLVQQQPWYGSTMSTRAFTPSCQEVAGNRALHPGIRDGGWHFSFLGGADSIMKKIRSYSETQTDTERTQNKEFIEQCLNSGADIFGRPQEEFKKTFVTLDASYPAALPAFLEKYPHFERKDF